ncbi:MAG: signal recognition particle GTPase [Aureispira sp.]|jgi:signal recognition particle GTPase
MLPYKDGYVVLMQAYYYTKEEGYDYGNYYNYNTDEKVAFKDRILIKFDKNFEQQWIQRIEQKENNKEYKCYLYENQILLICIKEELEKEVTLSNEMTLEERTKATFILNNPIKLVVGFLFEQKTGQVNKYCFFKKNSIDRYEITQFNLKRFHAFNATTFMAEFYKKENQDIMLRAVIKNK